MVLSGRNNRGTKSVFIWTLFHQLCKMANTNRVSNQQLEALLDYLAEHPSLAKGVGLGSRSKEAVDRQWNDLAQSLNAFGTGSSKTGERWKKYWADIKHKSKSRLAKRRKDAQGTGGGPNTQEDLSEVDKKVLAIIGKQAVYGDSQHRVPVFNIHPEEPIWAAVQPENLLVSEEVVMSEFPVPIANLVEAPVEEQVETQVETQQVPEPHQTEVDSRSPASQPARNRPPLSRLNRPTTNRLQTRIDPDWVMELERSRVQAENKMASATLMMAEAASKIAEAPFLNADTARQQLEVLKAVLDVVGQLSTVLAARGSRD